jgi:uncharacterized protein (TIGR02594 family)
MFCQITEAEVLWRRNVMTADILYPLQTLDTRAPWMEVAMAEMNAHVSELPARDGFSDQLRMMLTLGSALDQSRRAIDALASRDFGARKTAAYDLKVPKLGNTAMRAVSEIERPALERSNRAVVKYFDELKTDPAFDKKGRSFEVATTQGSDDGYARVTAWCAAFVNWCLKQVGAHRLGYATARSWLDFGQAVAYPIYGCVTIVRPSADTRSTTGHVAFFCGWKGNNVELLGGNQSDRERFGISSITKSTFPSSWVLGFRWPTDLKYYLEPPSKRAIV